jgi:hypothetical protein
LLNTVADFDPQQVVDAVQSKFTPEDWLVVTARRGPLFTQALKYGLYALASGAVSLICLYLGLAVAFHMLEEPSVIIGMTLLFFGSICGALGVFVFASYAWTTIRLLMAVQELWIAVTPNGIVEYLGSKRGIGFAGAFANVISIERINKQPIQSARFNPLNQGIALTFWRQDPSNSKRQLAHTWFITPWYPLPDQLAQIVIDAQRAYRSRTVALSIWNTSPALQPADARQRMRNNPMGWSWTLTVSGVLFLLMAFAWIAFVVWIYRSHPGDALPWLPYALSGFMLALGPICWLIAWRVNDWKIAVIE